ncbi:MAG: hypothetical protein JHC81_04985 [Brevundimonas sp.]|uniref:hypothetical protein n=1 Tax=Brevundimonas sp. TaxID=1871086 RepID=UPI001A1944E0|nr:hypothetical protein [Brevundimonas sp.]MBJ7446870.1 hypothetical protein [Brevundimonas sp.]
MTTHKGMATANAVSAEDLAVIADCYRRIQRIHSNLNHASPQHIPLMAATATLRACWADLSGATILAGWSYPDSGVTQDGLAPGADRSGKPPEKSFMKRIGTDDWKTDS